jgi:hypothetical protein
MEPMARDDQLRYTTAATVGQEHARATWALAARERLQEVARDYHAVITTQELAEFVQRRSLIRTGQQPQHWLGDVLRRVSEDCARRGEPLLPALCVDGRGRVPAGYVLAVETHRGERPADPDEHAAVERLECHRRWGAELPPGGGVPSRVERAAPRRTRPASAAGRAGRSPATKQAATRQSTRAEPKPVVTCPVHFTVLPANGVCDLCE